MLQIQEIRKQYTTGDLTQTALDGVSLAFRDSEFVAILGPSGSGKTTLLNIIGGLDRYDSGDLIIRGISTRKYKDRDWDSYRNHTIGFVFQSYNLIPHQSVLANVELAMTISGVSRKERRERARKALESVGLGDQCHKKPSQMSGGQMQRVAIARALVNNPDILLADEPTGALDTETSKQVMELLKEVAKDRLVVMVTHNPELAEEYANRTIRLRDGSIVSDSNPFTPESAPEAPVHKSMGRTSMSFLTALSLSLNNLRTKKARTLLTSFAGSIGIVGIALILALSSGINGYITKVQEDTLSSYPLSFTKETVNMSSMIMSMMETELENANHPKDKVYSSNIMTDILNTLTTEMQTNDLGAFKEFLEDPNNGIQDAISALQYSYALDLQIYSPDTSKGAVQLNPDDSLMQMMGMGSTNQSGGFGSSMMMGGGLNTYCEMMDNRPLLESQYDVVAGRWPDKDAWNEVVVVVSQINEISDLTLYSMGLLDREKFEANIKQMMMGNTVENPQVSFTYEQILGTTFKLVLAADYYKLDAASNTWKDMREDEAYMKALVDNAADLKVVGIIRPNPEAAAYSISGTVAYTSALTKHVIEQTALKPAAQAQVQDSKTDIFTGKPFDLEGYQQSITMEDVKAYISTLSPQEQAGFAAMTAQMTEDQILEMFRKQMMQGADKNSTYDGNLQKLGFCELEQPNVINLYCHDFAAKDRIEQAIKEYNDRVTAEGKEELAIQYTDFVGLMMSSVTNIIDMISYVLVGFVSISLVVSSIMIGIITYISVLERTKEIGILRAIGASKKNISSIFNAETLIVGFAAGITGIGLTVLLCIPVNAIIAHLSDVSNIAALPPVSGVILVCISMALTLIAGLIPSRFAAKKDPVLALRSE